MKLRMVSGFTIAFAAFVYGQTSAEQISFEVASIKPAPPTQPARGTLSVFNWSQGGPGSKDPGMYRCHNCTLRFLILRAYDLSALYQLTKPGWMDGGPRFEISTKVPPDTTKEQFRVMLQNLLAERFRLVIHREKKEMQVYNLVDCRRDNVRTRSITVAPQERAGVEARQ